MTARDDLIRERIVRHGFVDRCSTSPGAAVERTTALQAQDNQAARLGVRARAAHVTETDVLAAIADRSIVRTWLMRGTIHLVAAADLRWLVRLIGPAVARRYRTRWRQIGLSDALLDRMVDELPAVLAAAPLTRREIDTALRERGVLIDSPDPQAPTHAVVHASTTGLICRAEDRGRDATFTLAADWTPAAPEGPSGDDALAELARRYFAAYSPATAADFATWSGLPGVTAVELIRDELTDADVDGRPGYRLGQVEPARGLRLLPAFDNYLLGYRDRAALVPEAHYRRIYEGGMIRPVVLRDGHAVGVWSLARARSTITVRPFARLPRVAVSAVEAEAADVARFVGLDLELVLEQPTQ